MFFPQWQNLIIVIYENEGLIKSHIKNKLEKRYNRKSYNKNLYQLFLLLESKGLIFYKKEGKTMKRVYLTDKGKIVAEKINEAIKNYNDLKTVERRIK